MTPQRIAVIGAGAWGTALADLFSEIGHEVMLWVFEADLCARMASNRENDLYLPGIALHENLRFTPDLAEAASAGQDVLVSVMPSHVVRAVWTKLAPSVHEETLIASATKGVEEKTLLLPTQVISGCLAEAGGGGHALACLSGPTFARELAERKPTAVTAASDDSGAAKAIQETLAAPGFRIYTGEDPVGAQLGGALKNVIALAAGIADGMELGYNARGGAHRARAGRNRTPGRRDGRPGGDLRGPGGHGRSGAHVHGRPEPEQDGRRAAGRGRAPAEDTRIHDGGGRGCIHRAGGGGARG